MFAAAAGTIAGLAPAPPGTAPAAAAHFVVTADQLGGDTAESAAGADSFAPDGVSVASSESAAPSLIVVPINVAGLQAPTRPQAGARSGEPGRARLLSPRGTAAAAFSTTTTAAATFALPSSSSLTQTFSSDQPSSAPPGYAPLSGVEIDDLLFAGGEHEADRDSDVPAGPSSGNNRQSEGFSSVRSKSSRHSGAGGLSNLFGSGQGEDSNAVRAAVAKSTANPRTATDVEEVESTVLAPAELDSGLLAELTLNFGHGFGAGSPAAPPVPAADTDSSLGLPDLSSFFSSA